MSSIEENRAFPGQQENLYKRFFKMKQLEDELKSRKTENAYFLELVDSSVSCINFISWSSPSLEQTGARIPSAANVHGYNGMHPSFYVLRREFVVHKRKNVDWWNAVD
jgi:hypothetical protein